MGGGGTDTTTQKSGSTNPEVNNTVTKLLTGLQGQVDRGSAVFDKSLYAGLSPATQTGLGNLNNAAGAGFGGLSNAFNWANGQVNSGGLSGLQNAAIGWTGDVGNSYAGIANQLGQPSAAQTGFSQMASSARDPSLTESTLMNVAQGGAFGQNEPGYATLRQNSLNDALTGVGSSFLTDGRFGSSVMGSAAGEAATGVLANLDYTNYQNDVARQERALGAIEGQRQQGFQNQFNSLGASDSARLAQLSGQMGALSAQGNAAQTQFNMGQQGVSNAGAAAAGLPGFASAMLQPAQTQLAVGQMLDTDAQSRLTAENDLFRRRNDSGWSTLGQASSILAGTAPSSPQQQSTTTPSAPWYSQLLGGAAIGSGIYKNVWGS